MKKLMLLLPFVALLVGCSQNEKSAQCPVLTVEGGQIVGVEAESPGLFAYKGIPYAAAPIGDLRWKEPQPVKAWDGVKPAVASSKTASWSKNGKKPKPNSKPSEK